MAKKNNTDKRKMNPVLWFLFAIVIPIIITIALATVVLSIAGIDVTGWLKDKGNNIPVVSSFVETDKEKQLKREDESVKAMMSDKDAEIEQLKVDLTDKEATVEQLEQEIMKLENNQANENEEQSDDEQVKKEVTTVKTIANSFKDMDPDQAANILQELEQETALAIMKELSNDTRGSILESMNAETAAKLTQQFINTGN
ncbi:MAG: MotE family protein [Bacillota bacterium]|uniref:MotE family protein n=1 Tax=Virgibacillus salarius TaxID=447199 RepID=UPI002491DF0D|nr:hypothetical protein [Virgibacillus salarius]WBX79570.1 hypothetical protein PD280_18060 [Virgibacillus salarius]